jgi:hypothetical protein
MDFQAPLPARANTTAEFAAPKRTDTSGSRHITLNVNNSSSGWNDDEKNNDWNKWDDDDGDDFKPLQIVDHSAVGGDDGATAFRGLSLVDNTPQTSSPLPSFMMMEESSGSSSPMPGMMQESGPSKAATPGFMMMEEAGGSGPMPGMGWEEGGKGEAEFESRLAQIERKLEERRRARARGER